MKIAVVSKCQSITSAELEKEIVEKSDAYREVFKKSAMISMYVSINLAVVSYVYLRLTFFIHIVACCDQAVSSLVFFILVFRYINRMKDDLVKTANTKMLSEDAILSDIAFHRNSLLLLVGAPHQFATTCVASFPWKQGCTFWSVLWALAVVGMNMLGHLDEVLSYFSMKDLMKK